MRKLKTISMEEAQALIAKGYSFTPISLYEPDHAPKGTKFVMIGDRPYRLREPGYKPF